MTLTERDRRALWFGGIGVGAVAAYLLVVEPARSAYDEMRAEHHRLAGRMSRQAYEQAETAYYASAVAEWETIAEPLEPPRPFDEQATTVGEKLFKAAQQNSVNVKNMNWTAPRAWPDDPALAMVVLHIDAEAEWEPVFKFIAEAYRVEGVLSVEEMELNGNSQQGNKLTVSIRISVLVKAAAQGGAIWAG